MDASLKAMIPGFLPQSAPKTHLRLVPQETSNTAPEQAPQERQAPLENLGRRSALPTERGFQLAQQTLEEGGAIAQADWQFQQERGDVQLELTPQGERRVLLRGMTHMADDMFHQHTGSNGESYDKVALGDMLARLKGDSAPTHFVPRRGSAWQAALPQ